MIARTLIAVPTLRSDTEPLPDSDLARLLAALDQGVALLALSGITEMGGSLLGEGIRRIVNPAAAAKPTERADASDSRLDVVRVRQRFHEGGEFWA